MNIELNNRKILQNEETNQGNTHKELKTRQLDLAEMCWKKQLAPPISISGSCFAPWWPDYNRHTGQLRTESVFYQHGGVEEP